MGDPTTASGTPAVELSRVSYTYPARGFDPDPVAAVEDVSLRVERGQRLGILGPNGGGKSTLIKLILGLIAPTSGSVRVFGEDPARARREGRVGYLPQRIDADTSWPLSVRQVVELGIPKERGKAEVHRLCAESLDLVGMRSFIDRPIGALSGGQLQRVMIARAIGPRPDLLVLDEPTLGVDVKGQRLFSEMVGSLQSELGLTVVTVSHELRAIAASSDRIACLSRTLHFHDAPQGLSPDVLAQVFAHDVEGVFGEVHVQAHRAADCDDPSHAHHHDCQDHPHGEGAS